MALSSGSDTVSVVRGDGVATLEDGDDDGDGVGAALAGPGVIPGVPSCSAPVGAMDGEDTAGVAMAASVMVATEGIAGTDTTPIAAMAMVDTVDLATADTGATGMLRPLMLMQIPAFH